MEVKVFFRMLMEGRKIAVFKRLDDCLVQSISIQDAKHYEKVIEHYKEQIPRSAEEIRRIKEASEASVVSGAAAKLAIKKAFRKGGGFGRR